MPADREIVDLDRLDRVAAECMGWTDVRHYDDHDGGYTLGCAIGKNPENWGRERIPSPTRSWKAFGELLLWAAEKGLEPEVAARLQDEAVIDKNRWWNATLWIGPGHFLTENASDPRVALCLAVAEWAKGKEKP